MPIKKDPEGPTASKTIRQRRKAQGGFMGEHYEYRVLTHPNPESLADWEEVPEGTPEHDWRPG